VVCINNTVHVTGYSLQTMLVERAQYCLSTSRHSGLHYSSTKKHTKLIAVLVAKIPKNAGIVAAIWQKYPHDREKAKTSKATDSKCKISPLARVGNPNSIRSVCNCVLLHAIAYSFCAIFKRKTIYNTVEM
jgi:hypothetical protein